MFRHRLLFLVFACLAQPNAGFYVPGVAPIQFKEGDAIDVRAIKLTSIKAIVPFEYYSLPFCKGTGPLNYKSENLGEVLRGDRIVNTPYQIFMNKDNKCSALCEGKVETTLSADQTNLLRRRIHEDYHVHLLVDNLPVVTPYKLPKTGEIFYDHGYRLGWEESEGKIFLNNHVDIILRYHKPTPDAFRVVGFEAHTRSIAANAYEFGNGPSCQIKDNAGKQELQADTENKIIWTYSVVWEQSDVPWASRWDSLLSMKDTNIHWFSILNSLIVLACLTGFLSVIIVRTVRRDIAKYNRCEDLEDALEETGWKLVHADVFRPPRYPMLLVNMIGSGIQLIGMVVVVLAFAMLGMLSPSSRGSLTSVAIFLFCLFGLVAGYHAGRLYKTFKGDKPKRCAFRTATLFPAIILGSGFVINFFLIGKSSSGAIPFGTMIILLLLWLGVDLPLVFLGFHFGYRKQPYSHPVRNNQIPRQVPEQPWYLKTLPCTIIAGILPFGAVFIELYFIYEALWANTFYYLFGFLFVVVSIVFIACAQISIVVTYFLLCAENYRWWWKSFAISAGTAFYVLLYSVYYYFMKLNIIGFVPMILYFAYSGLIAFTVAVLTGTIGFYASYAFLTRIYGAVKID